MAPVSWLVWTAQRVSDWLGETTRRVLLSHVHSSDVLMAVPTGSDWDACCRASIGYLEGFVVDLFR